MRSSERCPRAQRPRRRVGATAAAVLVLASGCSGTDDKASRSTSSDSGSASSDKSAACTTTDERRTEAYRRIDGVDPDLTSLDIYAVAGVCDAPVVIWVHGGGYEIGDKRNEMKHKVPLANEHGWILVSVNYRLTRPDKPNSAKYPDHYADVAAAVAWVHEHIAEHGGDPDRLALLGHSAGADIVSNLITNPDYLLEAGSKVADLACAGPLDSEGFDKVTAGTADIKGLEQEWVAALGNLPGYLEKTSANLLIEPGRDIPPTIGVVRGSARRRAIETAFLDRLSAVGVVTTRINARGLSHHEVNANIGAPGDTVMTAPLVAFLDTCFAQAPNEGSER